MSLLLRLRAVLIIVAKRLLSQPGLALAAIFGLAVALGLVISIPIYSDGVYLRLLKENVLTENGENTGRPLPPLSFVFSYEGSLYGEKQLEEIRPVDAYLTNQASRDLGLDRQVFARFFLTAPYQLFPKDETNFSNSQRGLEWMAFATVGEIEQHISLLEGRLPALAGADGEEVEVLVSEAIAVRLGLQVGEEYIAFRRYQNSAGEPSISQIGVRVVGIWKATNPQDPYWLNGPEFFEQRLLVPESIFANEISPRLDNEIDLAVWFLAMNDASLHYQNALSLIYRIYAVTQAASTLLPDLKLSDSPVNKLRAYADNVNLLTFQLYAYSLPVLGLLLAFIGLSSSLYIEQRRNEIAILRSRGATIFQVLAIALLEGLVLGGVGLAISLPFGLAISRLIGQTRRFLDFTVPFNGNANLTPTALRFGAVAATLAILFVLIPAYSAARHTIITYKQERARLLKTPWWQRAGLDVLLFLLAAYAAYQLRQQGSIDLLGEHNPLENPLLFLIPALVIFAITLFFLRLIPLFVRLLSWAAAHTKSVGFLMAARHLARSPGFYAAPLMLLVLTLSLSTYTASLAQIVDTHFHEQVYYEVGSDLRFLDMGERSAAPLIPAGGAKQETNGGDSAWVFLPVSEYLKIPGVKAAGQIGRYTAQATLGGGQQQGVFLGINRVDFPRIAYWRRDFAIDNLGALMNQLALSPNGVLVPSSLMASYSLEIGDTIRVGVNTYGQNNDLTLKIVGGFGLFPSWYPDEGPLFVGNLDYLFEQAGNPFPYQVWIKTDPQGDDRQVVDAFTNTFHISQIVWQAARMRVNEEGQRPDRQGLFGVLSVGFIAAAVLTVLGFLLYALFSFKRRFIELGVLRATGLSTSQMVSFLAWELAFLILLGGAIGTGLGIVVSRFFIPYLQVGDSLKAQIPPYLIAINWPAVLRIYLLFGLLFVVSLAALVLLLRKMKIFQAIKLGESV